MDLDSVPSGQDKLEHLCRQRRISILKNALLSFTGQHLLSGTAHQHIHAHIHAYISQSQMCTDRVIW